MENIPRSSVYTRTGDAGITSLLGSVRKSKADDIFDIIGTCDELNSNIGVACEALRQEAEKKCMSKENEDYIEHIICYLSDLMSIQFDIGALFASLSALEKGSINSLEKYVSFSPPLENLEHEIDYLDSKNPKLHNFILPAGNIVSAYLHVCRSVTRRLERHIVKYINSQKEQEQSDKIVEHELRILQWINRLSDYFFVIARLVCNHFNGTEVIYKRR